jgi:hypothetical protein
MRSHAWTERRRPLDLACATHEDLLEVLAPTVEYIEQINNFVPAYGCF